ncbi:hypothetical protein ACIRQP_32095 [Streptomyces sp. NPDC102274]
MPDLELVAYNRDTGYRCHYASSVDTNVDNVNRQVRLSFLG